MILRAATEALEAEAAGEPAIVVAHRGLDLKVPTDLEDWPLAAITYCVGVRDGRLVVEHTALALALRVLLGEGQWQLFLREHPLRRDLVPLSQRLAEAAGVAGRAGDLAFGALPRLLATLSRWPGPIEATLGELGVDYRDRWRFDAAGRRKLTLRQIHVRLSHAAFDCPLGIAQNDGRRPLGATELLLMDLYEAIARQRHPSRPMTEEQKAERTGKDALIEEERRKYRERHNKPSRRVTAIETARANARAGGNGVA